MRPMTLPRLFRPWLCPDLIRLGRDGDGGYLVSQSDVEDTHVLVTLGVGEDTSFERAFLERRPTVHVGTWDHTVAEVDLPGVGDNVYHNPHRVTSYRQVVPELSEDVFLKMDIEGDEYDLMDDIVLNAHQLTGLVMEVHQVCKPQLFEAATNFISKLPMSLVHVHANNNSFVETPNGVLPDCLELTFSCQRHLELHGAMIPHPLDRPNTPQRPDFAIQFS